jgi:hypothetical protein
MVGGRGNGVLAKQAKTNISVLTALEIAYLQDPRKTHLLWVECGDFQAASKAAIKPSIDVAWGWLKSDPHRLHSPLTGAPIDPDKRS